MPGVGVEPTRPCGPRLLRPRCLPFHHPGGETAPECKPEGSTVRSDPAKLSSLSVVTETALTDVATSALQPAVRAPSLAGLSPYLRLQSDERLVALTRRGSSGAFEALVKRYESRLLSFCRHMLNSSEDAEDVLQEVFASAYHAMVADDRPINVRPWLYRIARNRALNHLRRPVHAGQDSMDVYERDGGATTADTVHRREEFRQIVADVHELPESQRTALLLREIDALSYEQISEVMETTVPSVKSLLVRARVSLAEAAEARLLTCEEARLELARVTQGLSRSTPPVRRHLKSCERCRVFKSELRKTGRALAAVYPIGPAVIMKNLLAAKFGTSAAAGGSGVAGGTTLAGGAAAAGGASAGGVLTAGAGAIVTKAAAGLVAATIVTAGVVEVKELRRAPDGSSAPAQQLAGPSLPRAELGGVTPLVPPAGEIGLSEPKAALAKKEPAPVTEEPATGEPAAPADEAPVAASASTPEPVPVVDDAAAAKEPSSAPPVATDPEPQEPTAAEPPPTAEPADPGPQPTTPPGESESAPTTVPAPVVGEPAAQSSPDAAAPRSRAIADPHP